MSSAVALFDISTWPYCVSFATIGHILISLSTKPKTALKEKSEPNYLYFLFEILKVFAHSARNMTF